MMIGLENFEATLDIAVTSLSIDEQQPDAYTSRPLRSSSSNNTTLN
jgi:hypothetical protein